MHLVLFVVFDEHLMVNFARKIDPSTIHNESKVTQVLQTSQPISNTIGYLCLEPSRVLKVPNLHAYLKAIRNK